MAHAVGDIAKPSAATRRPALSLCLLGGFELRRGRTVVPVPMSVERVLAFVSLQTRPVNRCYMAGTLWPETSDHRAAANLRSALWRLRRVSPGLVWISPEHVRLSPEAAVDVLSVMDSIWRVLNPSEEISTGDALSVAAPADLLPGWYDDWVAVERERLRQLRLHTLETLCGRLTDAGRFGLAVDAGLAAVRQEPLRDSAQRALIRAHLAEGNASEAIRQFRRYRSLLGAELGLEPSAEMVDLVRRVAPPELA